ncbi:hypothetical protein V491_02987 [Pseudogymnoascus sp. VKM F-3775]|nr:hypothetical protein V491_02987 [Pseudogymnoascus sp. VKM F-3775]
MRSSKSVLAAETPPPLQTGAAKLADVKRPLDKLTLDLHKICLLPHREQNAEVDVGFHEADGYRARRGPSSLELSQHDPFPSPLQHLTSPTCCLNSAVFS